ncbi:hypothetical protein HOG98_03085 [bacterium]|jgi:hypothetical protein|nr:hypothetical protein [bacterium]
MKLFSIKVIVFISVFLGLNVNPIFSDGADSMDFLNLGGSIQANAMGNSLTAFPGFGGSFTNPASANGLDKFSLSYMNMNYVDSTTFNLIRSGIETDFGIFFSEFGHMDYGTQLRTTWEDRSGLLNEYFSSTGSYLSLGTAFQFKNLGFGAALLVTNQTLDTWNANAVGLSFGMLYKIESDLYAGLAYNYITLSQASFVTQKDDLPRKLQIGLSNRSNLLGFPCWVSGDIISTNNSLYGSVGIEALVHKNIKLRGGYQSINSLAPSSFGLELLLTRFAIDVSVHPSDIFGTFYRFGITFNKQ